MKIASLPRRRARIEIIPLIDIVFFLLATFVMVSLSMVKNRGIPVNLPRASTSVADNEKKSITAITVTEGNELYFNKEKMDQSELSGRLETLKANDPDPKILINGDGKATFESAILVLDEVRKAGIKKVSIQTQGEPKK